MKTKQPKKIIIKSYKNIKPIFHKDGVDVDAILNNIKRLNRIKRLEEAKKEFEGAIDLHLISQNYKPARDNKGRFTKANKFNWDTLGYTLTCCAISALIVYTILG